MKLMKGVEIKDRVYVLKNYSMCFVGSEAVSFLISSGLASSEEAALKIGNQMIGANLIRHGYLGFLLFLIVIGSIFRFFSSSRSTPA